ncbi:MAG TPA: chemotaxis response regulator protein-glutamate methylesterase [Chromobacteriaceae bacterium]|nr:chemotaxis response regulator protein-glutamate methylesterase [Chromobacteriaceae bacterium]
MDHLSVLPRKLRVVVVDDSALMRQLLTTIINQAPDMEVVAAASDPLIARERIRQLSPDVVTLDVDMPQMNGLEFLRRLMRLRPTPVLMISALTQSGAEVTLQALALGAVDFWPKPDLDVARHMQQYAEQICDKLRAVAAARVQWPQRFHPVAVPPALPSVWREQALVCVGASTGGTEAILAFLSGLPEDGPPVLLVQHMPEGFTRSFAQRLDSCCAMRVKEAEPGETVRKGAAYLAPGNWHMQLRPTSSGFCLHLDQAQPVNRHRPAVDVLFASAARHAGRQTVGVILTGMGRDGADGLCRMRAAGALTLAQDEASCVVYGMPRAAVSAGGVVETLPLSQLAGRVRDYLSLSMGETT